VRLHTTWLILAFAGQAVAGPAADEIRESVRAYRLQHEPAIVSEFAELLAIPNHASDSANIRKNAQLIARSLQERKVETRLLELEGLRQWLPPRETGYESLRAALDEIGGW